MNVPRSTVLPPSSMVGLSNASEVISGTRLTSVTLRRASPCRVSSSLTMMRKRSTSSGVPWAGWSSSMCLVTVKLPGAPAVGCTTPVAMLVVPSSHSIVTL